MHESVYPCISPETSAPLVPSLILVIDSGTNMQWPESVHDARVFANINLYKGSKRGAPFPD